MKRGFCKIFKNQYQSTDPQRTVDNDFKPLKLENLSLRLIKNILYFTVHFKVF